VRQARSRARLFFERMAVAHVLGYPAAFVWACASIPLAIHLSFHEIDALHEDMDAIGHLVVHEVACPAGAACAAAHLAGLLWALAAEGPRGMRRFFYAFGAVAGLGVLFGAGSWLWLWLR